MNRTCLLTLIASAGVLAGVARAADEKKPGPDAPKFAFSLVDGSKLVCQLQVATLPVTASFGKVDLPLDKVDKIAFNRKDNTLAVRFKNGDQLQGAAAVETVGIKTSFGDYTIVLSNAVELAALTAGAAVAADAAKPIEDSPQKRDQCINQLRMIDSAKEQWALATRRGDGDATDAAGISEYIKGGRVPVCPANGTYKLNPIGANPECSVPGHKFQ